ncbi:MAG: lipocalin [Celeribacter sp.]
MPQLIALRPLALLSLMALAACAAKAPPLTGFRAADAPISSIVGFSRSQLAGDWVEVARYGTGPCTLCRVSFAADGTRATRADGLAGPVASLGPGRISLPGIDAPVWVLWIDGDARTLVLGTPSGAFGTVLNRAGAALPPDRLTAAREIFDFAGYDPQALRLLP